MDRCQVISTEETVSNTQQLKQILQMNSFDFYSPCAEKMETILSSDRIAYFSLYFTSKIFTEVHALYIYLMLVIFAICSSLSPMQQTP